MAKSKLVLLVEDEPVIALHVRNELEQEGHRVLLAANGEEALLITNWFQPQFALLNFRQKDLTDGLTLARQLHSRFHTKILFLTGAYTQSLTAPAPLDSSLHVLYKPFSRRQLRLALADFMA